MSINIPFYYEAEEVGFSLQHRAQLPSDWFVVVCVMGEGDGAERQARLFCSQD